MKHKIETSHRKMGSIAHFLYSKKNQTNHPASGDINTSMYVIISDKTSFFSTTMEGRSAEKQTPDPASCTMFFKNYEN